jgi:hypothetical protein
VFRMLAWHLFDVLCGSLLLATPRPERALEMPEVRVTRRSFLNTGHVTHICLVSCLIRPREYENPAKTFSERPILARQVNLMIISYYLRRLEIRMYIKNVNSPRCWC